MIAYSYLDTNLLLSTCMFHCRISSCWTEWLGSNDDCLLWGVPSIPAIW